MKKIIKSVIERLAGLDQTAGTPVNLEFGGGPRLQSTVVPDETLGFNEFWTRVYKLNGHKTP
jgi:hypothetical protein